MAQAAETKTGAAIAPLRVSRTFHARPETVFTAWSSAEHVARWYCPDGCELIEARVELRLGGPFEVVLGTPLGARRIRGTFAEIRPRQRLVIDATIEAMAGEPLFRTLTEVDFTEALGGTKLDIVQTWTVLAPDEDWTDESARQGWSSALDKLEAAVVRMTGAAEAAVRSAAHASFHLKRTYEAPVERVWTALTDPAAKAKWFSGTAGEWELLEREMDVRVGGRERLRGRWAGGTVSDFEATYHDVIPHERLVYSYVMHVNERKISVSLATLELRAEGRKTTLLVTEQGAFLDGYQDLGAREHGTGLLLDALGASLAG